MKDNRETARHCDHRPTYAAAFGDPKAPSFESRWPCIRSKDHPGSLEQSCPDRLVAVLANTPTVIEFPRLISSRS